MAIRKSERTCQLRDRFAGFFHTVEVTQSASNPSRLQVDRRVAGSQFRPATQTGTITGNFGSRRQPKEFAVLLLRARPCKDRPTMDLRRLHPDKEDAIEPPVLSGKRFVVLVRIHGAGSMDRLL